jgi:hypothetical protein
MNGEFERTNVMRAATAAAHRPAAANRVDIMELLQSAAGRPTG